MRIARLTCAVQQGSARGPLSIVAFDGDAWTAPRSVAGSSVTTPPTLARFGETLWCLHQDANTLGNLMALTFDGSRWSGEASQPAVVSAMTAAPAAAAFAGRLYVVNQGYNASHRLGAESTDGRSWSRLTPPQTTTQVAGSTAAAVFGELLYAFYNQAGRESRPIAYTTLSPSGQWSAERTVPGLPGLIATPGAAVLRERLHVCCTLPGKELAWAAFDGAYWEPVQPVPGTTGQVSGGVSAVAFEGLLYVLYRSNATSVSRANTLAYMTFDGTAWHGPVSAGSFTIGGEPAAAVF